MNLRGRFFTAERSLQRKQLSRLAARGIVNGTCFVRPPCPYGLKVRELVVPPTILVLVPQRSQPSPRRAGRKRYRLQHETQHDIHVLRCNRAEHPRLLLPVGIANYRCAFCELPSGRLLRACLERSYTPISASADNEDNVLRCPRMHLCVSSAGGYGLIDAAVDEHLTKGNGKHIPCCTVTGAILPAASGFFGASLAACEELRCLGASASPALLTKEPAEQLCTRSKQHPQE
jgi:hypothetical protein